MCFFYIYFLYWISFIIIIDQMWSIKLFTIKTSSFFRVWSQTETLFQRFLTLSLSCVVFSETSTLSYSSGMWLVFVSAGLPGGRSPDKQSSVSVVNLIGPQISVPDHTAGQLDELHRMYKDSSHPLSTTLPSTSELSRSSGRVEESLTRTYVEL